MEEQGIFSVKDLVYADAFGKTRLNRILFLNPGRADLGDRRD